MEDMMIYYSGNAAPLNSGLVSLGGGGGAAGGGLNYGGGGMFYDHEATIRELNDELERQRNLHMQLASRIIDLQGKNIELSKANEATKEAYELLAVQEAEITTLKSRNAALEAEAKIGRAFTAMGKALNEPAPDQRSTKLSRAMEAMNRKNTMGLPACGDRY